MPDASSLNKIAKANVDVKNGDLVLISNAGEFIEFKQQDGKMRTRLKIGITCVDGAEKELTLNVTSNNALIEGYGKNSEDWVGKNALVSIVKQNVGGELKDVIYLSPVKE